METSLNFASCEPAQFFLIICCSVLNLLGFYWLDDCSFADLQKPQHELDGKACAAVGQSSLMAYYETMFDQVM